LLTIVTPPDLVEFREWFLGEVTRQIDGLPPTRWSDYNRSSGPAVAPDRSAESVTETKEGRIAFRGELDLATASELQSLLVEEKSNGFGSLQVDLTGVTFIDSVGLSLLVSAHNRLTEEGGRLRILLPERLRPLFRLSGLSDLLDLEFPGDH
jgi:anti-anti-sigma factor